MKKALSSALVIVITFITIIAMSTFRVDQSYEATIIDGEASEEVDNTEGTGLIFEDFNKNINIPIDNKLEEKKSPDNITSKIDNMSSLFYIRRLSKFFEEEVTDLKNQQNAKEYVSLEEYGTNYVDFSKANESQDIEAVVSFQDKASILKFAKYLNANDISEIRRAISGQANSDEIRAIWENLKKKVPEDEYERLLQIVSKYE